MPSPVTLSLTRPLSENVDTEGPGDGGGEGVGAVGVDVSTIVSSPIGFAQQAAAALVSLMESKSMASALFGLESVLKSPNVFGNASAMVNTTLPFLEPVTM